jgi:hypothetical protein
MQAYIDLKAVKRNATIGKVLTYGGLIVTGIGVVIAFSSPEQYDRILPLFLAGLVTSQIGTPLLNRWARRPRMDEVLDSHLKGLDSRYSVWHYLLGASHALLTPAGAFAIVPRLEEGLIEYREGAWYLTPSKRRFLRSSRRRKMPPIERSALAAVRKLKKELNKSLGDDLDATIQPLVVFVHPDAQLQRDEFPVDVTHIKKLKEKLRRLPKGHSVNANQLESLAQRVAK